MHFVLDLMLFISSQPKGLVDTGKWRGRRRGRGSFYRETNQCESVRLTPAKSSFAKDLHSIVLLKLKIFTALSCSNQRSSQHCPAQIKDLHSIVLLKSKIFTAVSCSNRRSSQHCPAQIKDLHGSVLLNSKIFTALSCSNQSVLISTLRAV